VESTAGPEPSGPHIPQATLTSIQAPRAALLHLRCGYFMTNLLTDLDGLRAPYATVSELDG